jgi:hypothetical protein
MHAFSDTAAIFDGNRHSMQYFLPAKLIMEGYAKLPVKPPTKMSVMRRMPDIWPGFRVDFFYREDFV